MGYEFLELLCVSFLISPEKFHFLGGYKFLESGSRYTEKKE